MSLIRDPKNVWCHMTSEYVDHDGWAASAGQIACTIYDTLNAAVTDLKGFVKALHEGGHEDICDFTNDGKYACVVWTDKWTGKRMMRSVADLPF